MLRDQALSEELDDELEIVPELSPPPHQMGDVLGVKQLEALVGVRRSNHDAFNIAVQRYRTTIEKRHGLFSCIVGGQLHVLTYTQALEWVEAQQHAKVRSMARNVRRLEFLAAQLGTDKAKHASMVWAGAVRIVRQTVNRFAAIARKAAL